MVHINERPRWKRILFLECICVDLKGSIMMEGYVVLFLALTSPLWCWIFLPYGCMLAWKWLRERVDIRRRRPYGGIDIAECNTARGRWRWLRWRRSMSQVASASVQGEIVVKSPLFRLPEEIRREIFLHLVRPADELTICSLKKERRLVALPTDVWQHASADAAGTRRRWEELLRFFNNSIIGGSRVETYTCRGLLKLAKVNRQLYREVIPLLYGENIFHFHPLETASYHVGSIEHFLAFTHAIPLAHLQYIRHIRLRVNLYFRLDRKKRTYILRRDIESKWRRTCGTLKQMEHLTTLRILVRAAYRTVMTECGTRQPVDDETPERTVLKQLIGVRAKREFVVEVPWLKDVLRDLTDATFEMEEAEGAGDVAHASLLRHG